MDGLINGTIHVGECFNLVASRRLGSLLAAGLQSPQPVHSLINNKAINLFINTEIHKDIV